MKPWFWCWWLVVVVVSGVLCLDSHAEMRAVSFWDCLLQWTLHRTVGNHDCRGRCRRSRFNKKVFEMFCIILQTKSTLIWGCCHHKGAVTEAERDSKIQGTRRLKTIFQLLLPPSTTQSIASIYLVWLRVRGEGREVQEMRRWQGEVRKMERNRRRWGGSQKNERNFLRACPFQTRFMWMFPVWTGSCRTPALSLRFENHTLHPVSVKKTAKISCEILVLYLIF